MVFVWNGSVVVIMIRLVVLFRIIVLRVVNLNMLIKSGRWNFVLLSLISLLIMLMIVLVNIICGYLIMFVFK